MGRRMVWIAGLGLLFFGPGSARGDEPYRDVVLADGPIAYYEFEEAEGRSVRDSSKAGSHPATCEGGVTLGQESATGRLGRAARLDGATGRVGIEAHADFRAIGKGASSIEIWFRAERGSRGDLFNYKIEEGPRDLGIFSGLEEPGDVCFYEALGVRAREYGVAVRAWHHVVVTRDAELGVVLYVDGEERDRGRGEMSWDFPAPVVIGANHPGAEHGSVSFPFQGIVDEVAIYASALPAERVAAHYAAGDPEGAARSRAKPRRPRGVHIEGGLPEEGFEALANGRDLAGFRTVPGEMPGTFRVVDGAIVCTGSPAGYLYTERSYRDFTLRFEWRYARPEGLADDSAFPGNSGYLLAIQEHGVWPKSLEIQGMNRDAGLVIPIRIAAEFVVDRAAQRRAVRPVGEWNAMEIQSRGGVVTVEVNGVPTATVRRCEAREGPIGFQSEGALIHWRNLRIREERP